MSEASAGGELHFGSRPSEAGTAGPAAGSLLLPITSVLLRLPALWRGEFRPAYDKRMRAPRRFFRLWRTQFGPVWRVLRISALIRIETDSEGYMYVWDPA